MEKEAIKKQIRQYLKTVQKIKIIRKSLANKEIELSEALDLLKTL